MKVRNTKSSCISCATQVPSGIIRETYDDLQVFKCERCRDGFLKGVVAEGVNTATIPLRIPEELRSVTIPLSADVGAWEAWWTNETSVSVIHGRHVNGPKEMLDFVRTVQSTYDS